MFEYALGIFGIIAFMVIMIYIGKQMMISNQIPFYASYCMFLSCFISISLLVGINIRINNDTVSTGITACFIMMGICVLCSQSLDFIRSRSTSTSTTTYKKRTY